MNPRVAASAKGQRAARQIIRGLSSAGRAPDLHSGGHRFDPDRLHQHGLIIKHFCEVLDRPTGRKLTSFRENISTAGCPCKGNRRDQNGPYPGPVMRQVAVLSKSSTLTKMRRLRSMQRDILRNVAGSIHAFDPRKPCFFWIKSSAIRAFGGCLGSKRR